MPGSDEPELPAEYDIDCMQRDRVGLKISIESRSGCALWSDAALQKAWAAWKLPQWLAVESDVIKAGRTIWFDAEIIARV